MYFFGHSFFSNKYSMDATSILASNFTSINISNAIYDDIYVGKNTNMDHNILSWTFETILWARFQENLSGGNVAERLSEITSVLIKRRAAGKNAWIPIAEIQVNSPEDLKLELFDRLVANNQKYEYALVFLLNNDEGSYNVNEITSKFSGIFIVNNDNIFSSVLEPQNSSQRNHKKAIVETIDKKYPFVISQSSNNYDSGSASAVFVELNEKNCMFDFDNAYKYRKRLKDWLADSSAKVLKLENGDIWMVMIVDPISDVQEANTAKVTTSFGWAEIGDVENIDDLIDNGFIDIDPRRI